MSEFLTDEALRTLVTSGTVALCTFILGSVVAGVGWVLKEAIQALVKKLGETIAHVDLLDAKITVVVDAVGDVEKMKKDLNELFKKLREVQNEVKQNSRDA